MRSRKRPGGALLYFVIWDVFAFLLGWGVTVPFLFSEVQAGGLESMQDALHDWRFLCGLYFNKVLIGLLSFPFLIFALPLMQDWLTHVKPTGYDRRGNCVPKLSAAQIKAKFRELAKLRAVEREKQRRGRCNPCEPGSTRSIAQLPAPAEQQRAPIPMRPVLWRTPPTARPPTVRSCAAQV